MLTIEMTRAKLSILTAAITAVFALLLAALAGYFAVGLLAVALVWIAVALYQSVRGGGGLVNQPWARLGRRMSRIVLFFT